MFYLYITLLPQNLILVFSGLCFSFALVNLVFILTPKTIDLKYGKEKTVILVQPSVSKVRKVLERGEFLHGRTFVFLLGGGIDKNGNLPKPVIRRVEKAAEYIKAEIDRRKRLFVSLQAEH